MLHLYHFFRPKTRSSTCDEITKLAIDCWDHFQEVQYYNGSPLYINRDGRDTTIQYGTVQMRIDVQTPIDVHSVKATSPEDCVVYIGYRELGNERIKGCEFCILVHPKKEFVKLRETRTDKNYGYYDYDIEVPFDMMNEIDFFQFETLNPVLPISREVLVKLVDTIRKDLA